MNRRIFSFLLIGTLLLGLLAGCGAAPVAEGPDASPADAAPAEAAETASPAAALPAEGEATVIAFSPEGVTVTGAGTDVDDDGEVDILEAGIYRITGASDAGRVVVDAADTADVTLILDGCNLTWADDEVIYIKTAHSASLVLAEGTDNTLVSGTAPTEEDAAANEEASGAALRFKCPLTIYGSGALTVVGYINNGIGGSSDLTLDGGVISVTAVNDGVKSKSDITVLSGVLSVRSDGDGIQAEGTLSVDGGALDILTGTGAREATMKVSDSLMMGMGGPGGRRGSDEASGEAETSEASGEAETGADTAPASDEANGEDTGESRPENDRRGADASTETSWDRDDETSVSCKGLKAGTAILLNGGSVALDTEDDAIHCGGDVVIAGSELAIQAGDDGVHADTNLTISGGVTDVQYCYEGLEAQQILIQGGHVNIVATDDGMNVNGGSGMFGGPSGEASSDTEGEETASPTLRITGGVVLVDSGGDGLDSNGSIYIEGGETYVSGPSSNWDAAVDYGEGGSAFLVTGGTLMAGGYAGMAEAPDSGDEAQGSIYYRFDDYAPDGAVCTLTDSDGNVILTTAFTHSYNCVVLSSPAITAGKTYTLTAGDMTAVIEMASAQYSNRSRGGFGGFSGGSREASGETEG